MKQRLCTMAIFCTLAGMMCGLLGCQTPQQKAARQLEQKLSERSANQSDSMQRYESAIEAYHAGELDSAKRGLREAVNFSDRNLPAWNALGVVAFHEGDIRTAVEAFRRASQLAPTSYEPHFNLGTVLESIRQYAEAITAYETALALAPESIEVQENLARVLIRSDTQPERALELVESALEYEGRPAWRKWLELESIRLQNQMSPPENEPLPSTPNKGITP